MALMLSQSSMKIKKFPFGGTRKFESLKFTQDMVFKYDRSSIKKISMNLLRSLLS